MQIPVGEQALCQRAEGNDALAQTVGRLLQAVFLDGAVKDGVAVLVDDERHMQLIQDGRGLFQRFAVVVGQARVDGLAALHGGRQRAHGLFQRGVGIHAVVVVDVHIVQPQPLQALVQAGQQILAAAPVTIGAVPHGIPCLGADDELIPVGHEVLVQDAAQILLGAARLRTVVVGQVEVGDAVVEGGEAELLHGLIAARVTKIVPEPQRDGGQQQAALAAAVVRHGGITCIGCLMHKNTPLLQKGAVTQQPRVTAPFAFYFSRLSLSK